MARHIPRLILLLALLLPALALAAVEDGRAVGDTLWVRSYDHEFINWASAHVDTFQLPDHMELYSQVLLRYTIGCPTAPGDCDPWDRLGHLRVIHEEPPGEYTHYEIARIITPYDITYGTANQSCTWTLDVTDYKFLLTGETVLRNYIESWIGGNEGWLVTVDLGYVKGFTTLQPYKVVNLWFDDWMPYGQYGAPIENDLQPLQVDIPADAAYVKMRAIVTGHGQGNTSNCAEFCPRWHSVVAGDQTYTHTLWRADCAQNACSPQQGTWQYNRAGWCPGDKVIPWDNDVTAAVTPGEPAFFDYNVQDYLNLCSPDHPDCVSGVTCTDCNYNYTGHTSPGYALCTQLIFWREDLTGAVDDAEAVPARGVELGQNWPNPFNPATTFYYKLSEPGEATLHLYSAGGREILTVHRGHGQAGTYWFQWDGRDSDGRLLPSGVYFYEVEAGGQRQARKMTLLQ